MEPSKHQYDFDAQTVIGFLRHHGLAGDFKVNVEANHATLGGHSFAHELPELKDKENFYFSVNPLEGQSVNLDYFLVH